MAHAWDIRAWTYEADIHCVDCAFDRFGNEGLDAESHITDSEGNTPKPVFESDDGSEDGEWCGTCGEILSDPY